MIVVSLTAARTSQRKACLILHDSSLEWYAMRKPLELAVVRYRESKHATARARVERRPWALDLEDVVGSRAEPSGAPKRR